MATCLILRGGNTSFRFPEADTSRLLKDLRSSGYSVASWTATEPCYAEYYPNGINSYLKIDGRTACTGTDQKIMYIGVNKGSLAQFTSYYNTNNYCKFYGIKK